VPAARRGAPRIEGRDLVVRRGGRDVLTGVDCRIDAGEVVVIVGPNGAGKSTLLATLAGDLRPRAGEVRVDGRDLRHLSPGHLARIRAVLPQQHTVAFPFTVREVVEMGRAAWSGRAPRRDDPVVAEALAATDTAQLAVRRVTELSGGEQRRVALARVLAQDTPVLLLDEPTAGLDLRHQELVLHLMRARAAAGGAVGCVLHDLSAAAWCADRVLLLHDGRVFGVGPPACVLTPELLHAAYRHEVDVVAHPGTGQPLICARRPAHRSPTSPTRGGTT
jgi:iron complex transport system ATP-binding protein